MMKCEIIRDLIPLYLDKVCSEDSRKLVEEHLAECSECRKYMKELETELESVSDIRQDIPGRQCSIHLERFPLRPVCLECHMQ